MPTLRVYAADAAVLDYIVEDDEPYAILLCRSGNISLRIPVMSCWISPHSEITYRTPHRRAVVVTEHSVSCLMAVRCCASQDAVPQPTTVTDKAALMADNASASPERSGARSKETRGTPAPPVEHLGQKASASGNGWLLQTSCLVAD